MLTLFLFLSLINLNGSFIIAAEDDQESLKIAKKRKEMVMNFFCFLEGGGLGFVHGQINKNYNHHRITTFLTFCLFRTFHHHCSEYNSGNWGHALGQTLAETTNRDRFPAYNISWLLAILNS